MNKFCGPSVYLMGHFPAPWGNEIRAGILESVLAVCFSLILMLSMLGGMSKFEEQVHHGKQNLVCVMLDLVLAAMMAMLYTNDLFTGYVFIEIMTLAACSLIMATKMLSTMLYRAWTSMEIIMGTDMLTSSLPTGMTPILFSVRGVVCGLLSIVFLPLDMDVYVKK